MTRLRAIALAVSACGAVALLGPLAPAALAGNCTVEDAIGIHIGHMTTNTDQPDQITDTTAELNGDTTFTVDSGSTATSLTGSFFYGTDPENEIGNATPGESDPGDFTRDFDATVGGLSPNTTYYYQHLATAVQDDPVDVSYSKNCEGDIVAFTTLYSPPDPVALAPTDVQGQTATLQGTVNPLGAATTASFTYSPTGGGNPVVTSAQNVGSGSSPVPISAPVVGLQPNTTYSVVVSASNPNNSATSPAVTFTTVPTQPRARTGSATEVTATGATLNATVDPEGDDTDAHFEYGPTTSYGSSTAPASAGSGSVEVPFSAPVTGLTPGQTYHYRVVATSAGGTVVGEDASFTATSDAVVQTLYADQVTDSSARLNATVDPRGLPTQAWFDWVRESSPNPIYTQSTVPVLLDGVEGAVPFSSTIGGLQPNTVYAFRGHAVDSIGASYGSRMLVLTDGRAPDAETEAATAESADGATLHGTVNPNGSETLYSFEYGPNDGYGTSTSPLPAGQGHASLPVSGSLSGLLPNRTYHYRLRATNGAGATYGDDATFSTVQAPVATTALASGVTDTDATLLGQVDPRGRATSWWFEYGATTAYGSSTSQRAAGSAIGQVPVASLLTGLGPGTTYNYRLVAQNADGLLTRGANQTFSTDQDPQPQNVPPTAATGGVRGLTFSGQVDANGSPTTYYFQYGRTTGYGRATPLGSVAGGANPVPVLGRPGRLGPGRHHYRLVATSANGTAYGSDRVLKVKAKRRGPGRNRR